MLYNTHVIAHSNGNRISSYQIARGVQGKAAKVSAKPQARKYGMGDQVSSTHTHE